MPVHLSEVTVPYLSKIIISSVLTPEKKPHHPLDRILRRWCWIKMSITVPGFEPSFQSHIWNCEFMNWKYFRFFRILESEKNINKFHTCFNLKTYIGPSISISRARLAAHLAFFLSRLEFFSANRFRLALSHFFSSSYSSLFPISIFPNSVFYYRTHFFSYEMYIEAWNWHS
jgi:hypothetical protein